MKTYTETEKRTKVEHILTLAEVEEAILAWLAIKGITMPHSVDGIYDVLYQETEHNSTNPVSQDVDQVTVRIQYHTTYE